MGARRRKTPRLARIDPDRKIGTKKQYEERLARLQLEMLRVQQAMHREGLRAIVAFEGWDAAGKGGTIRRITERLDPRGFKVWPIRAPNPIEQGKHYLYRFWQRLPEPGQLAIFDRSWYGRVLVERVEGFASAAEWRRAYAEINEFERLLADDGVRLVKIFLHISPEEQLDRFVERLTTPVKRWKITTDDIRNRARWKDYESAIDEMLARTSTGPAPWSVIPANHKWFARVEALKVVTRVLGKGLDLDAPILDPKVRRVAERELGIKLGRLGKK